MLGLPVWLKAAICGYIGCTIAITTFIGITDGVKRGFYISQLFILAIVGTVGIGIGLYILYTYVL